MKFSLIGAVVMAMGSLACAEDPMRGAVCVASRAATPFRGQVIPPTGEVSSNGLKFKIDKRAAVSWPQRESLKIDGLDIGERHLLAVLDSRGKSVESLWFRFAGYKSAELCMSYDGYQGTPRRSRGNPNRTCCEPAVGCQRPIA